MVGCLLDLLARDWMSYADSCITVALRARAYLCFYGSASLVNTDDKMKMTAGSTPHERLAAARLALFIPFQDTRLKLNLAT